MSTYKRTEEAAIRACKSALKNRRLINVNYSGDNTAYIELEIVIKKFMQEETKKKIVLEITEDKSATAEYRSELITGKTRGKPVVVSYRETNVYVVKTPAEYCMEEVSLDFPEKIAAYNITDAVERFRREWNV